jgi:hypothetical protein
VPEATEGDGFTTEAQRAQREERQKGFWQVRGLNGERCTANASAESTTSTRTSDKGSKAIIGKSSQENTPRKQPSTLFQSVKPKIRIWREVRKSRSVPSVYERMSCDSKSFSGVGTEQLARIYLSRFLVAERSKFATRCGRSRPSEACRF